MTNPWANLPKTPPYIFQNDLKALQLLLQANDSIRIRPEVLPVPFLGNLETAEIVLLNLNPGFVDDDLEYAKDISYIEENRKCLSFESRYPLFYLDPRFTYTAGYKWWFNRLKYFIDKFGNEFVAKKFMCIEFFPYHSKTYKDLNKILPSQEYSFYLVKQAIQKGKLIIIMRSKKLWIENVPELKNYPFIELKNPRSPFITENNMGKSAFSLLINRLGSKLT